MKMVVSSTRLSGRGMNSVKSGYVRVVSGDGWIKGPRCVDLMRFCGLLFVSLWMKILVREGRYAGESGVDDDDVDGGGGDNDEYADGEDEYDGEKYGFAVDEDDDTDDGGGRMDDDDDG